MRQAHFPGGRAVSIPSEPTTPQRPQDVNVPFDVSHSNRSIFAEVKIAEYRSYDFYLAVYYKDDTDLYRVLQLTGDGSRFTDSLRYARPGVIIPLHVRVLNSSGAVMYEKTVDVQGSISHIFLKNHDGYFLRSLGGVALRPGTYRIEADTIKDTPEYSNEHCSFFVGWNPNTAPRRD